MKTDSRQLRVECDFNPLTLRTRHAFSRPSSPHARRLWTSCPPKPWRRWMAFGGPAILDQIRLNPAKSDLKILKKPVGLPRRYGQEE